MRHLPLSGLGLCLLASTAMAQGNPEAGYMLARQWCVSCHQVEPGAPAKDAAPPFASIANDRTKDWGWVRGYLLDPHLPMAGINLSRAQIDDVTAYLERLQDR